MKYFIVINSHFKAVEEKGLQRLAARNIPFLHIGAVCDMRTYGDCCTSDCSLFRSGTCRAEPMRDSNGKLWHVIPTE